MGGPYAHSESADALSLLSQDCLCLLSGMSWQPQLAYSVVTLSRNDSYVQMSNSVYDHINKRRGIIALDRRGTQQQRSESPTVTPGVRVNTRYINSTKGASSTKVAYISSISVALGDTGVYRHTTEPMCIQDRTQSLDLETGSTYNTHIHTFTR